VKISCSLKDDTVIINIAAVRLKLHVAVKLKHSTIPNSRGSVVSIVSGYRVNELAIEVRFPAKVKGFFFSSLCVQTGSGAHQASCTKCTVGPFPGAKARPGRDADHSLHLLPRSRMNRSYTSSSPLPKRLRGV
jgi:hypothetical protein